MIDDALRELRTIVERESGIQIGEQKVELLKNRIHKRLRALNLTDAEQYLEIIQTDIDGSELVHLLDVISTNHTFFWRESEHFPLYEELLIRRVKSGKKELRTWCAASSSGEEPYTLSFLHETCEQMYGAKGRILATDISTQILQKAVLGEYSKQAIAGLPHSYRRHFEPLENGENVMVSAATKSRVIFKKLNLAKFPYPLQGDIDFIFCRNVMIYFEPNHKQQIIDEMTRLLAPGGYLFISLSENLIGVRHRFQSVGVGVYRKPGGSW